MSFAQRCDLVFGRLRRPRVVRAFQQDRLELLPVDPPSARARATRTLSERPHRKPLVEVPCEQEGGAMPGRQQGPGGGEAVEQG